MQASELACLFLAFMAVCIGVVYHARKRVTLKAHRHLPRQRNPGPASR